MSTAWSASKSDYLGISEESQKDRVRDLIRSAGDEGACSYMFYAMHLPNARNRVVELRDGDGLAIETVRCDHDRYHAGERVPPHVRYVGWWWRADNRQLRLIRGI